MKSPQQRAAATREREREQEELRNAYDQNTTEADIRGLNVR